MEETDMGYVWEEHAEDHGGDQKGSWEAAKAGKRQIQSSTGRLVENVRICLVRKHQFGRNQLVEMMARPGTGQGGRWRLLDCREIPGWGMQGREEWLWCEAGRSVRSGFLLRVILRDQI